MADERERARAEERRFKIERQRWAFRFGIGILALVCLMYFVIQPTASAFGKHIDLPDGRVVFVIIIMAGSAVWSFDIKDLTNFASGINISFGKRGDTQPKDGKDGGSGGGNDVG